MTAAGRPDAPARVHLSCPSSMSSEVPAPEPSPLAASRSVPAGVETIFAALSSALLFALFLLLPVAGAIALAFAAVPLVRLTHRRGAVTGVLGCLFVGVVLSGVGFALGGPAQALAAGIIAFAATVLPVLAAAAVRAGLDASRAYLALAAVGFALLAGALAIRQESGGVPLGEEIGRAFDAMSPAPSSHGGDPESVVRTAALLARIKRFAQDYWVGLAGASWALVSAVSFYLGSRGARPAPSAERTRFEELRIPAPVIVLFVASGGGFALPAGPVQGGAADILMPLLALYFLAGLSIICHFARRWFRARILRAGLYALVIYFPLNVGVGLLGLFDWYADFRRRGEKAGTNP